MLIFSALVYLFLALLLSLRIFKSVSFSHSVIIFFLSSFTLNVLIAEVLSLLGMLNSRWMYLLLQLLFCLALAMLIWDPPKKVFKNPIPKLKFEFRRLCGWEIFLVALVSGILLLCLYIGALAPINNSDSLHTHLPRIYYWLQHGSLASWDAVTVTQLNYPVNISIQGASLFLLGRSEKLFYLVPWLALLAVVLLIYEIAMLLGASRRAALFAGLLGLSFPVVLLQTFSYQGDVLVATLVLAAVWFLLLYVRQQESFFLYLSFVPLAAALGSKQTAFLFLPFFLLALLILFIKNHTRVEVILGAAGVFLAFFMLLASYKFIQNAVERDHLESSMFAGYRYRLPFSNPGDGLHYATNSGRYLYQAVSLDGLTGRLKLAAQEARAHAFRAKSEWLNLDLEVRDYISEGDDEYFSFAEAPALNEDSVWFGPLSFVLFPIAVVLVLTGKCKLCKRYQWLSLVFMLTVFLMVAVLITGWSPTNGRYLILPMLVFTPLFAVLIPQKRAWSGLVTLALSIASFYLAISTLLINDARPLVTQQSLYSFQAKKVEKWGDSGFIGGIAAKHIANRVIEDLVLTSPDRKDIRQQSYYENLFHQSTSAIADVEFVNSTVKPHEKLYLFIDKDIIEYALFGVNKTRDLVPVVSLQRLPDGALVLVDKRRIPSITSGFTLLAENDHFSIYQKP
ncbi:MAG TPA: glycosyltransferase family 39 protein [Anaerolineaceae bacterium]|nr:glycosyltransferase family 39 protein [Anaerolineaceae bacterium]